jgi:hypothetical protein
MLFLLANCSTHNAYNSKMTSSMFLLQVQAQSEFSEDELLSVVLMKVPFILSFIYYLLPTYTEYSTSFPYKIFDPRVTLFCWTYAHCVLSYFPLSPCFPFFTNQMILVG